MALAAVDAKLYAAQAAKAAGWTAVRAEQTNWFRKDVLLSVICGYMGKEAVKFVKRLGDTTAESGRNCCQW